MEEEPMEYLPVKFTMTQVYSTNYEYCHFEWQEKSNEMKANDALYSILEAYLWFAVTNCIQSNICNIEFQYKLHALKYTHTPKCMAELQIVKMKT